MDKHNIFIEALYEFKCSCRSIFSGIIITLSVVGFVVYQFIPTDISSMNGLFRFSMDWISRVFSSSIAYKAAFFFNIVQLLFVVTFVASDSRLSRLKAMESLYVCPLNNSEFATGSFLGKFFFFTLVNFIVFAVSILINVSFYPRSFDLSVYLFYWVTLTLPTLVYVLGFSYLVARFIRHQGISLLFQFAFLIIVVYFGGEWLSGLFDPCARFVPNMFSDFTGHVNLENYLLQRGFTLFMGIGFLVLSVIPYPRIPNYLFAWKKNIGVACGIFIIAGVLAIVYNARQESINSNRDAYRQVYAEHAKYPAVRVVRNDLLVKELENGDISVVSEMVVANKASVVTPLVIYLNPGLKVKTLEINGQSASFRRDHQALITGKTLNPGESLMITIRYEGGIKGDLCFLDTGIDNSSGRNRIGIYDFGYMPAFCGKGYKLLTPECLWYPVCVPPYEESGIRDVNFSRYSLSVEHDPRLTAISQGNCIEEKDGKTEFSFNHDMPGISLCVGNYKKRVVTIDSTLLSLYFLPDHEYLLDEYDMIQKDTLPKRLLFIKETYMESHECLRTSEFMKKYYSMERNDFDPTQQYPYRWFMLVEVPAGFHCFPGKMQRTGERVQGGIVFFPEKAYSIKGYPFEVPDLLEEEEKGEYIGNIRLSQDVKTLLGKGSCDIKSTLRGKTTFISSREYPILHDVLINVARGGLRSEASTAADYAAVEYLSRNSLKDALNDNSLSPEKLENIIRKKSEEFYSYISLLVGNERFNEFFHDFLVKNIFKETTAEVFLGQFYQVFGIKLDSLVEDWYNVDRLPVLDIQDPQAIKMTEMENSYRLYCFRVFNRSNVSGVIQADDQQAWIIPPREGREIRMRVAVYPRQIQFYIGTPLAQNLPARIPLEPKGVGYLPLDTTTGVFEVDSSLFLPVEGENEIIVDNEDPGFRVVKTENIITSLFREEKECKRYYDYVTEDTWLPMIKEFFYGFPLRSAYYKSAGTGSQKVEWNARLPRDGKYEVFFYYTTLWSGGNKYTIDDGGVVVELSEVEQEKNRDSRYYVVFDGTKEHNVVASPGKDEMGTWVSLGVFDFSKNARVTLSDRGVYQQGILADAVKWVRVKE